MISNKKKIQIKRSNKKLIKLLSGCIFFVVFGLWMFFYPETFISTIFRSILFIRIIGGTCTLFASISIVIIVHKLFDRKSAIEICENGILDNSSAITFNKIIKWSDIYAIEKQKVLSSEFLNIYVQNNKSYIEQINNPLIKCLLQFKLKNKNSPITSISSASVNIAFDELEKIIMDRFQRFKTFKQFNDDEVIF